MGSNQVVSRGSGSLHGLQEGGEHSRWPGARPTGLVATLSEPTRAWGRVPAPQTPRPACEIALVVQRRAGFSCWGLPPDAESGPRRGLSEFGSCCQAHLSLCLRTVARVSRAAHPGDSVAFHPRPAPPSESEALPCTQLLETKHPGVVLDSHPLSLPTRVCQRVCLPASKRISNALASHHLPGRRGISPPPSLPGWSACSLPPILCHSAAYALLQTGSPAPLLRPSSSFSPVSE